MTALMEADALYALITKRPTLSLSESSSGVATGSALSESTGTSGFSTNEDIMTAAERLSYNDENDGVLVS